MSDPLKPDRALLCKLGSILIHVEEYETGLELDMNIVRVLLKDDQVQGWLFDMNALALLPVKRS